MQKIISFDSRYLAGTGVQDKTSTRTVGLTAVGRQGIGATKTLPWIQIHSEVRGTEDNRRQARAVEMGAQGAWTTQDIIEPQGAWTTQDIIERKLTWEDIWKFEPLRLSFLLRSVHDFLPSPANLCLWGLTTDPSCK